MNKYFFMAVCLVGLIGCDSRKIITNLDLNDNWKITAYDLSNDNYTTEKDAKNSLGTIAKIQNNIFSINLLNEQFKCKIDIESKEIINVKDYDLFNPYFKDSTDPRVFNLMSKGFTVKTEKTDNRYASWDSIYIDGNGEKIVITWNGAVYLLERALNKIGE